MFQFAIVFFSALTVLATILVASVAVYSAILEDKIFNQGGLHAYDHAIAVFGVLCAFVGVMTLDTESALILGSMPFFGLSRQLLDKARQGDSTALDAVVEYQELEEDCDYTLVANLLVGQVMDELAKDDLYPYDEDLTYTEVGVCLTCVCAFYNADYSGFDEHDSEERVARFEREIDAFGPILGIETEDDRTDDPISCCDLCGSGYPIFNGWVIQDTKALWDHEIKEYVNKGWVDKVSQLLKEVGVVVTNHVQRHRITVEGYGTLSFGQWKFADPIEDARRCVDVFEFREIQKIDPSLVVETWILESDYNLADAIQPIETWQVVEDLIQVRNWNDKGEKQ